MTSHVMTSHYSPPSAQQEREVMGTHSFLLPDCRGPRFFQLTTRTKGRASLSHCVTGLSELDGCGYREVVLYKINEENVKGWPHTRVVCFLTQHLTGSCTILTLRVKAKDNRGRRHTLEVVIEVDIIDEDGPSIGDKVRAVYSVVVRIIDHYITIPDVTDVSYDSCQLVRIRHGALVSHFMKLGPDNRLYMAENIDQQDGQFKCYYFHGHDQTPNITGGGWGPHGGRGGRQGGCGDGGDGDRWPTLCVLQDRRSGSFVEVNALTSRLTTDPDKSQRLDKGITQITKPDGHFFIQIYTDQERSKFCLTPLILKNYYLHFDAFEGLKLEKLADPPYCTPLTKRQYDFEFTPA